MTQQFLILFFSCWWLEFFSFVLIFDQNATFSFSLFWHFFSFSIFFSFFFDGHEHQLRKCRQMSWKFLWKRHFRILLKVTEQPRCGVWCILYIYFAFSLQIFSSNKIHATMKFRGCYIPKCRGWWCLILLIFPFNQYISGLYQEYQYSKVIWYCYQPIISQLLSKVVLFS